jgi:5-methyltetrahydropteroyltriglutamate--homocysteine methyltransferase
MAREIEVFRVVLGAHPRQDAFLTTTAPASLEPYRKNEFYKSEEEFVYAIADAMRIEYQMIAQAGFLVQVDDAWIPALWDRIGIKMGLAAFKNYCLMRVEALNHALKGIAPEQIRYHFCWGSWHGPHVYDIPMADIVDVMLRVNAQCYLFEAANPRHEHEYVVWESVKLPPGKIIVPGMVTHSTDVVEHPELVSQRIQRFAKLVGKENVMAGADCGFGRRSHPQIGWAKLKALVEGAALARLPFVAQPVSAKASCTFEAHARSASRVGGDSRALLGVLRHAPRAAPGLVGKTGTSGSPSGRAGACASLAVR